MGQGGEENPEWKDRRDEWCREEKTDGRGGRWAGTEERAHLDERPEALSHRGMQDAVAGGSHIQCVSPALCHGAHRTKTLGYLGRQEQRRQTDECRTDTDGAGNDMLGRGGSSIRSPSGVRGGGLNFIGPSPPPHLHLLQLAVVRTPKDHTPIAAPSGHQRPVPQGAERKHTAIMGTWHRLCDAVPTYAVARGKGQHGEVSPVPTPKSTLNSQSYMQPFTHLSF